jgi:hypothetical protein
MCGSVGLAMRGPCTPRRSGIGKVIADRSTCSYVVTPTGSFSTVGTMTVPLQLSSGTNTIEFADPSAYTPDFDRIIVGGNPN